MDQLPPPRNTPPFAEGSRTVPYVVPKGSKGKVAFLLPGATTP